MKKLVVALFVVMFIGGLCQAVTIFETFREDVIADTTDDWIYVRESSAWGGVSYMADDQYIHAELARNNTANTTCRLYTALDPAYTTAPESWIEFDFRTCANNTGYLMSLVGMLDKDSTILSGFNYFGMGQGSNSDIQGQSHIGTYIGNTYSTDNAGSGAFTVGQAYRAKAHIYTNTGNGNQYIALALYVLNGNVETVVEEVTVQTKIMVNSGATFSPALDAFGIFNEIGSPKAGTVGHRYDVDNLYFSTDGPNQNTVEPFVPEPATIAILAIGGLLVSRRKR